MLQKKVVSRPEVRLVWLMSQCHSPVSLTFATSVVRCVVWRCAKARSAQKTVQNDIYSGCLATHTAPICKTFSNYFIQGTRHMCKIS